MTTSRQRRQRRQEIEEWWALVSRILAFALGGTILMVEAMSAGQRFYLIAAGITCLGPLIAQGFAGMIAAFRGGGTQ